MYYIYIVNTTHKLNMTEKDFTRLLVMVSWDTTRSLSS